MITQKLDDYLKAYNLPQKEDVNFVELHKAFKTNNLSVELITSFVHYGLHDVIICINLMNKVKTLPTIISEAKRFGLSIKQRLTNTTAKCLSIAVFVEHYNKNIQIPTTYIDTQQNKSNYTSYLSKYVKDFET